MNRPAFRHLHATEIGSYRPGIFYSESFAGIPWESDLLLPAGVGREPSEFTALGSIPGGHQKTLRLVVLLHEVAHYVHDLSLGAELERDFLVDQAAAILFEWLRRSSAIGTVRLPVPAERSSDQPAEPAPDTSGLLDHMRERLDLADALMGAPPGLADWARGVLPLNTSLSEAIAGLTGHSLLESVVATQTARSLVLRIRDARDIAYLAAAKDALHVLPEQLPELYSRPRHIFDGVIGSLLTGGVDYRHDDWPAEYQSSPRALVDLGFLLVADAALHIPPAEMAMRRVEQGLNVWMDFIPAYRFVAALWWLRVSGGFPDFPDGSSGDADDVYYRTLFDVIATAPPLRWPTLRETNDAWKEKIAAYKRDRRSVSDGYRGRMLVERDLRPGNVVTRDPLYACGSQNVPVYHLTPTGFKTLRLLHTERQSLIWPAERPALDVFRAFVRDDVRQWEDAPATLSPAEAAEEMLSKEPAFEQEIVGRSFCFELQQAALDGSHFACPFAEHGCQVATPDCRRITELDTIPAEGCALREYMTRLVGVEPGRLRWSASLV
jgi:hypothetical protein